MQLVFIYLWLAYRASIWLWPVEVILPAVYIVVYFATEIYASSGITIDDLLAAMYGWYYWLYGGKWQSVWREQLMISEMPVLHYVLVTVTFVPIFFAIWLLKQYTDSKVSWIDGFIMA